MDWRDEVVPPQVVDAAAAHGLGALLTSARGSGLTPVVRMIGGVVALLVLPWLVLTGLMALQVAHPVVVVAFVGVLLTGAAGAGALRAANPVLYLFEGGAVVSADRRRAIQVVPWAELVPIENERRGVPFGGASGPSITVLDVHGPRGRVFRCEGREAVRLADVIASVELPRARAALRLGSPVRYGSLTLTPDALVVGPLPTPWADVTRLHAVDHHVVVGGVFDVGPVELLRVPRREVPHQRTLIALGEQLGVAARQPHAG
ncbi:hypothetical protein [Pseudonocardia humida]|uniref:Cell division protein FtsQ n=1 Tax=Pseudonocardia humida TaxID=2800819 RepID=A0ABT0ZYI7_9PSEU|nr:hypothetical protein [Pseudonocardia humida]MCO1655801.1 hypothetical protein [Pseudonocardia humida]